VLLIACANLTNLLLARGVTRRRELALRTALGASRGRLIEQSLTELVPLLTLGSVLGVIAAAWALDLLVPMLPADLPRVEAIGLHLPVLAFSVATVSLVVVFVGLWPAVQAAKHSMAASIAELSRRSTVAPGGARARDALVIGQIALTVLLLVGALVLMRSFLAVREVSPGFNPDNVLTAHLAVPRSKYRLERDVAALYTQVLDRVQALPGVVAAGMVNRLPLAGGNQSGGVELDGITPDKWPSVETRSITPDYFRALGIPVKEGRTFASSDVANAPMVAIIDERLARTIWPGASPIGHRLREGNDGEWSTIIGVVGHVRHSKLEEESRPQVYWNYTQRNQDRMALVVKTRGQPAALTKSIAAAVRSVDADQPLYDVRTFDTVVDRSLGQRWFQMVLLAVFAGMALVLASIGAYGVIAYGVGQRLNEFGVRMALGAQRWDVIRLVLRRGLTLFGVGAVAGLALAAGTVRVLSTLVYSIAPNDTASVLVTLVVLFAVSMAACYLPARRAAQVDPSMALRSD